MFTIFAYLSPRTLGDFAAYAAVASAVRELYDDSRLFIYYRGDRPYKQPIASCIPNAAGAIGLAADAAGTIPVDYFDCHHGRPTHQIPFWEKNKLFNTDLILSGNMMNELMLNTLQPVIFRPPADRVESSDAELAALGLDPSRWFACVYWKEAGYEFRQSNFVRTIFDPQPYIDVIRYIIEGLGGQVVRLGHPSPTALPPLKGLVDLAKVPGSEWLQLYAVSRARFYIASSSGPAAYGPLFGIPTVNTDQDRCVGVWGEKDYVVTQGIEVGGRIFRQTSAFDAGYVLSDFVYTPEVTYHHNTGAELIAAANEMAAVSSDCLGWRAFAGPHQPRSPRPNTLSFPIPRHHRRDLLIPPTQR